MKSPFPEMDPYLEQFWGDVHTRFAVYACEQLQPRLPEGLRARVEEYLAVEADAQFVASMVPGVSVAERPVPSTRDAQHTESMLTIEPLSVPRLSHEKATLRSIRILDIKSGHRIVTAIEILSPSNRRTRDGRRQYRKKQRDLLDGGVNLVEIDLIRGGRHNLAVPAASVSPDYRTPYRVCVVRALRNEMADIYKIPLREPLPPIRIPLRAGDPDVLLELQPLIDRIYETGDYAADIDYNREPLPRLTGTDAMWANALLREHEKRQD